MDLDAEQDCATRLHPHPAIRREDAGTSACLLASGFPSQLLFSIPAATRLEWLDLGCHETGSDPERMQMACCVVAAAAEHDVK